MTTANMSSSAQAPLLGAKIQDIVAEIDPNYTIDTTAQEQVLTLVDDFIDKVVKSSMRLAQHRGSRTLDVTDVQLILAKQWGITLPGLGPPLPLKSTKATAAAAAAAATLSASRSLSSAAATAAAGNSKRKAGADDSGPPNKMAKTT
jgi:transcription initiation factor TFIID subunit TAF12